ncbi:MAG: hypothetical protein QOJ16_4488 [Acidobacteriota bacterium]|jgi:DNA repair photolyase|nr:hypothetical protein [Acidobacteriota bacterium]
MNAPASLLYFPALPFFGRPDSKAAGPSPALERSFEKAVRRGRPIVLGTVAVPFTLEASTRPLLAALSRAEGLEVSITTRSPLIVRHVELLADLDRRSAVTVRMLIPTVDPELAASLEPEAADPRARLRAVRQLSEEGIETRVLCSPWLPGLHDRESILSPLFAAAREAGAYDVQLPRESHAGERTLSASRRDRRLALFQRLRLEHGFPQTIPGRG